jgi:hypothetical protein
MLQVAAISIHSLKMDLTTSLDIVFDFKELLEVIDVEAKSTKTEFSNYICEKVSLVLNTPALKVKRSDKRKQFLSVSLLCVSCSKKYEFKLYWSDLEK